MRRTAALLGAVSAWYARGRVRKVYLADAAIEVAFLVGWMLSAVTDRRPTLNVR